MAIAIRDSVTVSIAALTSGSFKEMLLVNHESVFTSAGRTLDFCGSSRTSSNVSDSLILTDVSSQARPSARKTKPPLSKGGTMLAKQVTDWLTMADSTHGDTPVKSQLAEELRRLP
jgi:hypothetical protein